MPRHPRRSRLAAAVLAVLAATAVLPATAATPAPSVPGTVPGAHPGAPGIGDPYFPLDGNGGLDVEHYDVAVAYDLASGRLHGTTRLRLRATESLSRFDLDFLLDVDAVTVDGHDAAFARRRHHELLVTPRRALAAGTGHTVAVRYADRPARYGYLGERNWLADRHEAVAMNQPHMAPWWFPANDHPADKATYDLAITTSVGEQAIANGLPAGRRRHGDLVTWRWREAQPMATYLAFFAVGRFRVERGTTDGLPWVNAVSRRLPAHEERAAVHWLRRTPGIVRWLVSEIGPYPFTSTGGLVTSLSAGFALENQTRPTYPFFGTPDWLLVHELAHQWFGDAVAVRRWRDIWLNEGVATYFEQRWAETHGGVPADVWLRQQYDAYAAADAFWQLPVEDPGPARLFDNAVYDRGAMTLVALRRVIGSAAFTTLLRQWVATHTGGTGTTEEFRALAAQISGRDLAAFFDAWLATPAKPAATGANGLG